MNPVDSLNIALEGRYRIAREIGRGGMATVYLAEDLKHKRNVALKVLLPELAAMIGADRFLKEIEVTANLQHPHILPLFDSGLAETRGGDGSRFLYYVMPFVEGDTLRDKLRREKQLGVEEAVELTRSVAAALDYAHRRGVVHRDIKPENVLLHDGQAMVADFGIALAVREAGGTRLTGTGLSVGTPSYMSPEQAMGDRELDARSDIYSLGAMLYEMLAGDPPFTGSTAQAIVAKILTEAAPAVTRARASVPGNVGAAIHKALERLPADRFASAAEFADALSNPSFTVQGMAGSATASTGARSLWNSLSVATTAVALVAILALVGVGLRPEPGLPVKRLVLAGEALVPGGINRIALAPDGSAFVYAGQDASGASRLMLRRFEQLGATALPGTEGGVSPAFSPDGERIAFLSNAPFSIKVVSTNGAPAITLEDQGVIGGGVAWSKDDWIYFDAGASLDRVRGGGGGRETVVALDSTIGEVGFAWPEPLPNGKGLIFRSRRSGETVQNYVIKAMDLETRTQKVLLQAVVARYVSTGHLVYVTGDGVLLSAPFDQDRLELTGAPTPLIEGLGVAGFGSVDLALSESGDLMYLSTEGPGGERISWGRRDGTSEPVDPEWEIGVETIIGMALSPDGKRLALAIGSGGGRGAPSDIWVKDLDTGPMSKLTFEGVNYSPAWTRDGSAIVYIAVPSNDPNIVGQLYRIRADGTGSPEPLLTEPRGVDEVHVSPVDDWIVVSSAPSGSGAGDILAFRPGRDTAMVPLLSSPSLETLPRLSPDGRLLAYVSMESGRPEVYVRPFPGVTQGKWQVSVEGAFWPRWTHSGSELLYLTLGNDVTSAEVRTTPTFSVGRRRVLHNAGAIPMFEVAPDDQRFLRLASRARSDSTMSQLVLVQNFLTELKAKTPR